MRKVLYISLRQLPPRLVRVLLVCTYTYICYRCFFFVTLLDGLLHGGNDTGSIQHFLPQSDLQVIQVLEGKSQKESKSVLNFAHTLHTDAPNGSWYAPSTSWFALVVAGRDPSVVIVEMMFLKLVDSRSPSRVRCQMASSMCAGTVLLESLPKQKQLFFISFYQRSGQCMLRIFNDI